MLVPVITSESTVSPDALTPNVAAARSSTASLRAMAA